MYKTRQAQKNKGNEGKFSYRESADSKEDDSRSRIGPSSGR